MQQNGILTDEMITKFFKHCADLCFNVAYSILSNSSDEKLADKKRRIIYPLDAYIKLAWYVFLFNPNLSYSQF